jgi:hypothetical protein
MEENPTFNYIENIGKLRDGLLVIVTITYITGYVAWSYIAWTNGFGALPVLDAQYFLAGFPLILTAVLVVLIIRFLKSAFLIKWPTYFLSMTFTKQVIIQSVILIIPICSFVLIILIDLFNWPSSDSNRIIAIILIFTSLILFYLLFEPKGILEEYFEQIEKKKLSNSQKKYNEILKKIIDLFLSFFLYKNKSSYIYTLPLIAGIVTIYLYLSMLYPQIPHEFGGAKPRNAILDIVRSDLSIKTINNLVDTSIISQKNKILPTKIVTIYLVTKDAFIIKTQNVDSNLDQTFEISRSAVKSINWINAKTANKKIQPTQKTRG